MTASSTPDLAARILAAIEETERIAQAATPGPWEPEGDDPTDDEVYTVHDGEHGDLVGDVVAYVRGGGRQQSNMAHIARQDPKATLLRCAAARDLIAEVQSWKHRDCEDGHYACPQALLPGCVNPCDCGTDRRRQVVLCALEAAYNITPEGN